MTRAFVGLGANLGDREATIRAALGRLAATAGVELVAVSEFRQTDPWGPVPQPRYVNAAAELETTLTPRELLQTLLSIEQELGRVRGSERYGPRTIDLDLLVYGDVVVVDDELEVPHPRLADRAFVLDPLSDLDPELVIPGRGTVAELRAALEAE